MLQSLFIKKRFNTGVFLWIPEKFFKKSILKNISERLFLKHRKLRWFMVNAQQLFIICWLILLQMFDFGMLQVLLTSLVWKQQIKLARPNSSYKLVSVLWCQDIFNFFVTNSTLTHSFLMHTFSAAWKHQKTLRFSNVFRG